MVNFLFWNIRNRDLRSELSSLCKEQDVDVLILAECALNDASLLSALNTDQSQATYVAPFDPSPRFKFITRYHLNSLTRITDGGGVAIRRLRPPIGCEILLVALHLPSKLHRSDSEQTILATQVQATIREAETRTGNKKSLVIGDMNMNPFDHGMTFASGMHAVMDKDIALKTSRRVDGTNRDFFYNPMWSRLGDDSEGPSGTYYYNRGGELNLFWHTFDQVLLRPALLSYYAPTNLRVITSIGDKGLLKSGRIDSNVSDHLPLFLKLDLERGEPNG